MTDLYLIAHKVRGEPAFDIASRMECPHCKTYEYVEHMIVAESNNPNCDECNGDGFWWIIPTSGHRAYPYWSIELGLSTVELWINEGMSVGVRFDLPPMPLGLPDHYPANKSPDRPSLSALLANRLKPTAAPFKRRL